MPRYFVVIELEDGAELHFSKEDAISKARELVKQDSRPRHVLKLLSRIEIMNSPAVMEVFTEEGIEDSDDQEEPHSSVEET